MVASQEELISTIAETRLWLEHAAMALDCLKTGVDDPIHIPYVVKDILEAVNKADVALENIIQ